jgi:hypothetical protein
MLAWSVRDVGTIQGFILELDNGSVASDFRVRTRERRTGRTDRTCLPSRKSTTAMKQCVQLMDFFHPMFIQHESKLTIKQVKVPIANVSRFIHHPVSKEQQINDLVGSFLSFRTLVSWFTFNPRTAHPDIEFFSYNSDSISCLSLQERVVLGSRGFRQGVHYWEMTIQRYDDKPDPAFGIARFDASKENMLGTTDLSPLNFYSFLSLLIRKRFEILVYVHRFSTFVVHA